MEAEITEVADGVGAFALGYKSRGPEQSDISGAIQNIPNMEHDSLFRGSAALGNEDRTMSKVVVGETT